MDMWTLRHTRGEGLPSLVISYELWQIKLHFVVKQMLTWQLIGSVVHFSHCLVYRVYNVKEISSDLKGPYSLRRAGYRLSVIMVWLTESPSWRDRVLSSPCQNQCVFSCRACDLITICFFDWSSCINETPNDQIKSVNEVSPQIFSGPPCE